MQFYRKRLAHEYVAQTNAEQYPQIYKDLMKIKRNPLFFGFEVNQWSKDILHRRVKRFNGQQLTEFIDAFVNEGCLLYGQLENSVWWKVLAFMDIKEILGVRMVCRDWFKIVTNPAFWRSLPCIYLKFSWYSEIYTDAYPFENRMYLEKWTKSWLDIFSQVKFLILEDDLGDKLKEDFFEKLIPSLEIVIPNVIITSSNPQKTMSLNNVSRLLDRFPLHNTISFFPTKFNSWYEAVSVHNEDPTINYDERELYAILYSHLQNRKCQF
jgi:hypothetical protein